MTGIQNALNGIAENSGRESADYVSLWNSPEWKAKQEARKTELDAGALEYLRAKFPEAPEKVFFTNSSGVLLAHIADASDICDAAKIDYACANCKEGECLLPEKFRDRKGRPVASLRLNPAGTEYLCVRWTCGISCKNEPLSGEFGRMFRKSGLAVDQLSQTFDTFERYSVSPEVTAAKGQALLAAHEGSCLVLAGKAGTGKTHLATALAIEVMRHGKQAIFRLVSELVDELRKANVEDSDRYQELMKTYKEVPCLVLDDMGKERITDAGLDYVYQIVDYRYRHKLQTVVTTNAQDSVQLSLWEKEEYITPMMSRITGRGAWVTINNADDYRQKSAKRGVKKNASKK